MARRQAKYLAPLREWSINIVTCFWNLYFMFMNRDTCRHMMLRGLILLVLHYIMNITGVSLILLSLLLIKHSKSRNTSKRVVTHQHMYV